MSAATLGVLDGQQLLDFIDERGADSGIRVRITTRNNAEVLQGEVTGVLAPNLQGKSYRERQPRITVKGTALVAFVTLDEIHEAEVLSA